MFHDEIITIGILEKKQEPKGCLLEFIGKWNKIDWNGKARDFCGISASREDPAGAKRVPGVE
jgi:hypothetical protein